MLRDFNGGKCGASVAAAHVMTNGTYVDELVITRYIYREISACRRIVPRVYAFDAAAGLPNF
jgi:hypothetical protein